jgi:hypothetical protein
MKVKFIFSIFAFLVFCYANTLGQSDAIGRKHIKGETDYVQGKIYKKTGKPLVKRSSVEKLAFLKMLGLKKVPSGYEIDHIIPLSQGGEDNPENMQLLTKGQHKIKTAIERGEVAKVNDSKISYSNFDNVTQKPVGVKSKEEWDAQKITSAFDIDKELSSKKILFEGSRGGTFYYNANGKKTYVRTRVKNDDNVLNVDENHSIYKRQKTTDKVKAANLYQTPPNSLMSDSSTGSSKTKNVTERIIQTGPRGGRYYINSNGNKTYIKKN